MAAHPRARPHRGRHRIEGPERLAHATFSLSAAATASWSLKGNICSPTIWPVSWPLPATSSTSPGCNAATARRIASPRSPISVAPRAAGQDGGADRGGIFAARIVVGDDHAIGLVGRDRAHQRPLALIAVAAGAEHHDQFALGVRPQRVQRLGQRIRLVRVVDKDRSAVTLANELEPAFGALRALPARETPQPARCRSRSPGRPRPARSRPGKRRPAAAARDTSCPHARSCSVCAKPSIALSSRRMPSPLRPTVRTRRPALLRRRHHRVGMLMVDVDHRCAAGDDRSRRTAAAWRRDRPPRSDDNRDDRASILVKPPAATRTPSSRCWSSPCEEASMARCVTPSPAKSIERAVQRRPDRAWSASRRPRPSARPGRWCRCSLPRIRAPPRSGA